MTRFRTRLRSFAWLAFVAMAALAFGPSVSRALGADAMASGAAHVHHMAMDPAGAMAMAHAPDPSPSPSQSHSHSHHSSNLLDCCELCAIAAAPMVVLSLALPTWQPAEPPAPFLGEASNATPPQRVQWPDAVPRGPPVLA